ncbi:aminopeptidase [Cytophagales bacterium WSM2-2]|nr:aminopeptidase [Cytophagales bacterium WSM2-2]
MKKIAGLVLVVFFSTGLASIDNGNEKNTKMKVQQAEKISAQLFEAIEKNNLIVPGKTEKQIVDEITKLAFEKFGIEKHWHKKIVRSGRNTTAIYNDNPPDVAIQKDDIVIVDFGIIADGWESDYARTYVLGSDAKKIKLKKDVEKAWYETQAWYRKQTKLTGSDFFKYLVNKAKEYGYTYGGEIGGHIVGEFPHEQPANPKSFDLDVHPDNHNDLFSRDANGNERHWILEMHFVDKENNIGAYMEQLL